MLKRFLAPIVALVLLILVAQIPIFPLLVEVRSFSQDGESLSQDLQFVSIPEFYHSAIYARTAWLDSTLYFYIALFVLNHATLLVLFWICTNVLKRLLKL